MGANVLKRPRHTMRQIAATVAAASRLPLFCRCDMSHKFKPVWIRATDRSDKFCRSDNDFHMSHEAICCSNLSRRRVAAICRIVCLGLNNRPAVYRALSRAEYESHLRRKLIGHLILLSYSRNRKSSSLLRDGKHKNWSAYKLNSLNDPHH